MQLTMNTVGCLWVLFHRVLFLFHVLVFYEHMCIWGMHPHSHMVKALIMLPGTRTNAGWRSLLHVSSCNVQVGQFAIKWALKPTCCDFSEHWTKMTVWFGHTCCMSCVWMSDYHDITAQSHGGIWWIVVHPCCYLFHSWEYWRLRPCTYRLPGHGQVWYHVMSCAAHPQPNRECINTHTRTHTHAHAHTHMHTHTHTHTHMHTHAHAHAHTRTRTKAHTKTHTCTHTHARTRRHTHTHTHTHTGTDTHKNTHYVFLLCQSCSLIHCAAGRLCSLNFSFS